MNLYNLNIMKSLTLVGTMLLLLAYATACQVGSTEKAKSVSAPKGKQKIDTRQKILTVNDVPLYLDDINVLIQRGGHSHIDSQEKINHVLDLLIRNELIYQQALALGLGADATYQKRVHQMEAQLAAFKRKALAQIFFKKEILAKSKVSETEMKNFYEANQTLIRTEFHVWQIFKKNDKAFVNQALSQIKQGIPFEAVAMNNFPHLKTTAINFWDMGYLKWDQIPASWKSVLDHLNVGETSDIIRGPQNRFWIIKLIDRRENPNMTFENASPVIRRVLQRAKIKARRSKVNQELRKKARIVYAKNKDSLLSQSLVTAPQ